MTTQHTADAMLAGWQASRNNQNLDENQCTQWREGYAMHERHKANVRCRRLSRCGVKAAWIAIGIVAALYLSGCSSGGTVAIGYQAHTTPIVGQDRYDRAGLQRLVEANRVRRP